MNGIRRWKKITNICGLDKMFPIEPFKIGNWATIISCLLCHGAHFRYGVHLKIWDWGNVRDEYHCHYFKRYIHHLLTSHILATHFRVTILSTIFPSAQHTLVQNGRYDIFYKVWHVNTFPINFLFYSFL